LTDPEFNKLLGPRVIFVLVGSLFFLLFVGGFYWDSYKLPTMHGAWVVNAPGKYLTMLSFLIISCISISFTTPLIKYKQALEYLVYIALILLVVGTLILN